MSVWSSGARSYFTVFAFLSGFSAFVIFAGNANALDVYSYPAPQIACQVFASQGLTIIRNLPTDCLAMAGSGQTAVYSHFYDAGDNFCVEISSAQGRIYGPNCIPISQTGRTQQKPAVTAKPTTPAKQTTATAETEKPKLFTPPYFKLKELQYDTLPTGVPIQTLDGERIEITLGDGTKIQLDSNATFTPVSNMEVQSVFGRFRHLWMPFHDGKCIVGQNLARQDCRKITTPHAVIAVRGTDFLVDTNASGTKVTVLEGLLGVADLNGKKTVEVTGGQSTYVAKGGLPEDPKSFDPSEIDRWWEEKPITEIILKAAGIACAGFLVFMLIIFALKRFFGIMKSKSALPIAKADEEKKDEKKERKRKPKKILWFKL